MQRPDPLDTLFAERLRRLSADLQRHHDRFHQGTARRNELARWFHGPQVSGFLALQGEELLENMTAYSENLMATIVACSSEIQETIARWNRLHRLRRRLHRYHQRHGRLARSLRSRLRGRPSPVRPSVQMTLEMGLRGGRLGPR